MKMQPTLILFTVIIAVAIVAGHNLARPKADKQLDVEDVEEAMDDTTLETVQKFPQLRFLWQPIASLLGQKGNFSDIIANAPQNTTSLTFVPLVTLLAAGSSGTTNTGTSGGLLGGLGNLGGTGTGGLLGGLGNLGGTGTGGLLGGLGNLGNLGGLGNLGNLGGLGNLGNLGR